jgi:pyridoxal 5'-phosphate synthase pdxT subunit
VILARIGVLALQGDFEKHGRMLEKAGAVPVNVRSRAELEHVSGLIIPGGESTTIGKLLDRFGMLLPLREKIANGFPVFGTCAGTILLAREIIGREQLKIGTLEASVNRNAYGSQADSFEADIIIPDLGDAPVRAVFIRAPVITGTSGRVRILGLFEERPVLVRQDNMLAATFHPELTTDERIHRYFISMI